jgi:hypothetical protein
MQTVTTAKSSGFTMAKTCLAAAPDTARLQNDGFTPGFAGFCRFLTPATGKKAP